MGETVSGHLEVVRPSEKIIDLEKVDIIRDNSMSKESVPDN